MSDKKKNDRCLLAEWLGSWKYILSPAKKGEIQVLMMGSGSLVSLRQSTLLLFFNS